MDKKDLIEFFVWVADYQPMPFVEVAETPLQAIESAINKNVNTYPGYFAKESELEEPNLHFKSFSGYWVKDLRYPMAEEARWDA